MVPAAQQQGEDGPDDVGEDVEGVEVAAVGQEGLRDFGADAQAGGDGEEGQVDAAAAGGFDGPVEGYLGV